MSAARFGLFFLAIAACSRTTATTAVEAGAAPAAPSVTVSLPAAPASASPHRVDPVEAELLAITKRWNDALAHRDAAALRSIYGARVQLYENLVDREVAIKTKAAALASAKDYTQSIRAVEIDHRAPSHATAAFDKKWSTHGKEQHVRGSLVFANEGGRWVVVGESDAKTDDRRARAAANRDSCEALAIGVVLSTAEAARLLAGPTDPDAGHATNGFRLGSGPPETSTYAVGIHENHDDYLVTLAWFEVDPKTGKVTSSLEDAPQKADPALVERMKAACAKASHQ